MPKVPKVPKVPKLIFKLFNINLIKYVIINTTHKPNKRMSSEIQRATILKLSIQDIKLYLPGMISLDRLGYDIKTAMEKLLLYISQEQLPGLGFLPMLIFDMYKNLLDLIEKKIGELKRSCDYYISDIATLDTSTENNVKLYNSIVEYLANYKAYLEFMTRIKMLYTDIMQSHISTTGIDPTPFEPEVKFGYVENERITNIAKIDEIYFQHILNGLSHYHARLYLLYGFRRAIHYVAEECDKAGVGMKEGAAIVCPDIDLEGIQMRLNLLERESAPF